MKEKIITPVRALPKIVPIIQAKQISRVPLVIAWTPSLKIKSVIHRTILRLGALARASRCLGRSIAIQRLECDVFVS